VFLVLSLKRRRIMLHRVMSRYLEYYHRWRPHSGLDMDAPDGRRVQGVDEGRIVEMPEVYACTITTNAGLPEVFDSTFPWSVPRQLCPPAPQRDLSAWNPIVATMPRGIPRPGYPRVWE